MNQVHASNNHYTHLRQCRLIRYITFELVLTMGLIVFAYSLARLWGLVAVLSSAGIIVLLNLWLLIRKGNTHICSHILISVSLFTITSTSYLVWGGGSTYSWWFYLIPLLAASLVGWRGLLIYSALALLLMGVLSTVSMAPYYHFSAHRLFVIEWVNHLFVYVITVTVIVHLLRENKQYEQILQSENYLLQVEKDKFQYLAHFDQLTNLPNREYFKQHLQEILDSLAAHYCATVFFMDLDNLKYVNDYYGHEIGDHLLLQSARRLQSCFRTGDFIARLGGDEFTAIVLHTQDENIPQIIARRIIKAFKKTFILKNIHCSSSVSIGLSTFPHDTQDLVDLIAKADQAMYRAKKRKGSFYCMAVSS